MLIVLGVVLFTISTVFGQDINLKHIHYYYYPDTSNATIRKELQVSTLSNTQSNSELAQNTGVKFIVHGALGTCLKNDFPIPAITAYLNAKKNGKFDYNIICMEYTEFTLPNSNISPSGSLDGSRYTINTVGDQTAKLIFEMVRFGYLDLLKNVHLIGHSLGAHVAAGIGRKVYQMKNYTEKIGRISGLDPVNPIGLNEFDLDILLDQCDADFVDVYHTDSGRLGQKGKMGQVDFYPDGGESQRNCRNQRKLVDRLSEITIGSCSHLIVGKYWAASVEDWSITACEANNWLEYQKSNGTCNNPIVFGEGASSSARGRYFLNYPNQSRPS